jgi:hypothetical protein
LISTYQNDIKTPKKYKFKAKKLKKKINFFFKIFLKRKNKYDLLVIFKILWIKYLVKVSDILAKSNEEIFDCMTRKNWHWSYIKTCDCRKYIREYFN